MALTYDERLLTGSQRLRLRENNDANFRHAMNNQAHERFVERRLGFVGNHGGAVSPFERNALSGEADRLGFGPRAAEQRRLQEHEMNMLRQKGDDEVRVAEQKRFGMREQGQGAAEIKANSDITNTEREWAGRENIARQQGKDSLLTEQERQRGGLAIAKQQGKDSLLTEKERQGGALALETKRGENAAEINKATLESQERINKATLDAQQGRKGAMTPEQESAAARDLIKQTSRNGMPTMSYEDALKQIRGGWQQGGEAWPGYSAEATAELKRRGYILVNGKPVKNS